MKVILRRNFLNILALVGFIIFFILGALFFQFLKEEHLIQAVGNQIEFADTHKAIIYVSIAAGLSIAIIFICLLLLNYQLSQRTYAEKKLQESEKELYQLAYYNSLTGLPNRSQLIKKIDEALENAKQEKYLIGILHIDLDNFKNINESFGYEIGDHLLQAFAARLDDIVRIEKIIAHPCGDEFIILLKNIDQIKNAELVAKNILVSMVEPLIVKNHQIFITASIGISTFPSNGTEATTLLKSADIAMHRAKEEKKNNYQLCTQDMTLEVEERALLEHYLYQAVLREEFILLYQPKINLRDDQARGVEALIRWNHSSGNLIYPSHFISLAERNGLIVTIGEWMLRTACNQIKEWQTMRLPITNIAINISTRQLNNDFIKTVSHVLQETNINPGWLEFEITESMLMENSVSNICILRKLKEMGIKITIDDFGTGFSSLSYLRLFSIDKIKIDQSFVKEISTEEDDASIIKAIIVMAHSLGIKVVAEGVEAPAQIKLLKKYQCDEAQGFYYSVPLNPEQIQEFFA